MRIAKNQSLAKFVTLRAGGVTRELWTPESEAELIDCYGNLRSSQTPYALLGMGSNSLLADDYFDGVIVRTTHACRELRLIRRGGFGPFAYADFHVGASVPNKHLIAALVRDGYECPWYLSSVPGCLGGALAMNAGTGVDEGQSISDFVRRVRVLDDAGVSWLSRDACRFGFRRSRFVASPSIVLGAELRFSRRRPELSQRQLAQRLELVARTQDTAFPNAGSTFSEGYVRVPEFLGMRVGDAMCSRKSHNWLINAGKATAADLLEVVARMSDEIVRRNGKPPTLELRLLGR